MPGLFIENLFTDWPFYVTAVATVILSITLHEVAHGVVATRLGDPTPRQSGHMTWNPLVHMGPFSLIGAFVFGLAWGQMPVDPTRLRGKYGEALVAAAGPATNLVLALVALTALGVWGRIGIPNDPRAVRGTEVLFVFGFYNALLCFFNLLPAPPLDGSRILGNFHRGYADWIYDPRNQGAGLMLFVGAFFVVRALIPSLANATSAYVGLVAG